ncbi:MAG: NYN domain-containing protein [Candidatus Moranbacteria bacterium]|jgi:uncharacterized LabA/DUF88 family protein|nr:NYN domain-containing protein [Candidatus Moranbacteria bacterium]MDX9855190.1 NYN domain-containing protein [Candidatus Moranbacteria bacterium]
METIGIFIDNSNFISDFRENAEYKADYKKFIEFFSAGRTLTHQRIYLPKSESDGFGSFCYLLKKLFFKIITKELKKIPDGRNKCNFDVEIAVDIMDIIAERNLPDVVVLVSGDSDFCYLIERIKKEGSRVIVVGSYLSVSVESKAAADSYIFTENISDEISL